MMLPEDIYYYAPGPLTTAPGAPPPGALARAFAARSGSRLSPPVPSRLMPLGIAIGDFPLSQR